MQCSVCLVITGNVLPLADAICSGTRFSTNGVYNVTYDVSGDSITFTIQAQTTGWVGLGFSLDQLMVSHSFMNEFYLSG